METGKSSSGESSSGSGLPDQEASSSPTSGRPAGPPGGIDPGREVSSGHPAASGIAEDDIDNEEEFEGDELEDPDEEEEDDVEDDGEPASCPFCGMTRSCEHKIIFWSGCNCDWVGPFPRASSELEAELVRALWELVKAKRSSMGKWTGPLKGLVQATSGFGWHEDPENCDWWNIICDYWFEVADGQVGCERVRDRFDGGYPGSSDVFEHVYAKDPEAAIKGIMDDCRRDLEAIRAVLLRP